ncbi:hypothetical protein TREES_T100021106 [Tupaia chinensis]|uniref:CFAP74 second Ig-like domain-containing protein n=1 Tax=Tupaia chinensis TaxID=246437 RepID=L8YI04_TUPCH|nr:hypothetical protein TREES_T100021106 [Tupaia chinensis]
MGRLQAVSRRLCTELEDERGLQSRLTAALKESGNAMWHVEMEEEQCKDFQKSKQEEAEEARRCFQAHADQQLRREKEALGKAERNRLLRIRKSFHIQKEYGLRHQKLVEDIQKNHRIAVKFLKASLGRIREQERKEEMESRQYMQRRMDAVLALKNNITANRETLRKFQAWGQAKAELAEQKVQAEKEAILAQGGDAFKHLFHQRKQQELEAQQRAFEEEQKLRKQEIVSRILKEEAEEETRRKKQHRPAKIRDRRTSRDKTWSYISDLCEGKTAVTASFPPENDLTADPEPTSLAQVVSSDSVHGNLAPSTNPDEETLAEPEISGLWNEDHKLYQVPKEEVDQKPVGGTKMDKDILARTMEQLRSGVVRKQVVSGHEFKGRPFNSKPELIHFKASHPQSLAQRQQGDFDIGKVYKKKITLINATYTINYCKLVGVEEHLRDFIHIEFDPPGPMSAGMSCEVLVTFKPMLSLDQELIDFGSYVVGETASRTITLTNAGGLGTRFRCLPASELCELDDSWSILKVSSLLTYEEKSIYEKIITGLSEQQFEGDSSPVDVQSWKESGKPDSKDQEEARPGEPERTSVPTALAMTSSEEQTEIALGKITEGEIGPFSSIKVPVIFTPVIPGEIQTKFKVMFKNPQCPTAQESLDIITKRGTLTLTLTGTGVASTITCSIEGDVLNMGYVIARESVSVSFKLQNNSSLPIKFSMQLDSLSSKRVEDQQQLPTFLASPAQRTDVVGTQNHNGQSVFSVVPVEGVMDPGKVQDFTVTFSPDHESLYYSDQLRVVLFKKKLSQQILLKGAAREHMMFVEGGDPLDVPVESLTTIPVLDPEHREEAEELKPILVTLEYVQFDKDTPSPPATRELQVGCIRTTQLSPKKDFCDKYRVGGPLVRAERADGAGHLHPHPQSLCLLGAVPEPPAPSSHNILQTVEFSLDSITSLQHKGFSIEPSKGFVERGQTKTISISWLPPSDFDPDHPLMVSALLQLRGDVKETYKVIFVAQVVTSS